MIKAPPADAKVVALFTGQPHPVAIRDLPEPTAYARQRRAGPLAINALGLEGDTLGTPRRLGHANHALYLMAQAHYAPHAARLGRAVPVGGFSENVLYSDGPEETEIRIGDRFRLGDAEITVTSPRVPCYKMAHFLQSDQGFPAAFSASGRTGFYARVEVSGEVGEGDSLTLISRDPRNATVAALNHAMTDPQPDPGIVAEVLNSPALLPELAEAIAARFADLRPELAAGPVPARIVAHQQIAPGIASIAIRPTDDAATREWTWKVGQFVTLGPAVDGPEGEGAGLGRAGALRCYSLTDGPGQSGPDAPFVIAVRRGDAPAPLSVSRWLVDEAAVGATLMLYPPAGEFVLSDGPKPVLLIGGGIGMTPILAMFKALAARSHAACVDLVQVARGPEELIFAADLAQALSHLPLGRVQRYVTRTATTDLPGDLLEKPLAGRPDLSAVMAAVPPETEVFVCGPSAMIADAAAAHRALGRAPGLFHSEAFGPAETTDNASDDDLSPADIHLAGQGSLGKWMPGDGPLLGWIEARLGRSLPASCRSGLCRTCAAGLKQGRMRYPPGIAAPQRGLALLCCARPDGDVELALPAPAATVAGKATTG
jgi:ferredoxin-NADP reductase/MOSC domain-containing protein YiiM